MSPGARGGRVLYLLAAHSASVTSCIVHRLPRDSVNPNVSVGVKAFFLLSVKSSFFLNVCFDLRVHLRGLVLQSVHTNRAYNRVHNRMYKACWCLGCVRLDSFVDYGVVKF